IELNHGSCLGNFNRPDDRLIRVCDFLDCLHDFLTYKVAPSLFQAYLPLPPPPVRGAPPNPGAAVWFEFDFAALAERVWPVTTISPSTRLPSTISVDAPSVRPILIRRRCGVPS